MPRTFTRATSRPVDLSKAKALEDQVELMKGNDHDLKLLKHSIDVDTKGQSRAQFELQGMVRGYMNLLKDMAPV